MRVFAFCGPIGAPINELINQLPVETVIDEAQHLNPDMTLNVESIMAAIDSQDTEFVLVSGHTLYTSKELRNKFEVKIFVDADKDTCLSNYLREGDWSSKEGNLNLRMTEFIDLIKPKNDLEIYPTKKYADFVVPFSKVTGPIVAILSKLLNNNPVNAQELSNSKSPSFFQTL